MTDLIKRAHEVGFMQAALEAGALVTGGPVPKDFESGWGKHPFKGRSAAHYWTARRNAEVEAALVRGMGDTARGLYSITSACGMTTHVTNQVPLLGAGNLPFCALCENALMGKVRKT